MVKGVRGTDVAETPTPHLQTRVAVEESSLFREEERGRQCTGKK